jgi:hypothetical protein
MGMKKMVQPPGIDLRRISYIDDQFYEYTSGARWTTVNTGSGTNTISTTAQDGVLVMANSAATNDAQFVYTTALAGLWAAGIQHSFEITLQFSEASTNNANVWAGFTSLQTVAQLVNASAGPAVSFTGAGFFKKGGSTVWSTISSQSTTQNVNTTTLTAGQTAYQRLRIDMQTNQNSQVEISYYIDQGSGEQPILTGSLPRPLKDVITLSSPATMYFGFGIKNGTTSGETLNVDMAGLWKLRTNFVAAT